MNSVTTEYLPEQAGAALTWMRLTGMVICFLMCCLIVVDTAVQLFLWILS